MKVWEFAAAMRLGANIKSNVTIIKDGEAFRQCRMEDIPYRENFNRHPRTKWVDTHLKTVHMDAKRLPSSLSPEYEFILVLDTEPYPTV